MAMYRQDEARSANCTVCYKCLAIGPSDRSTNAYPCANHINFGGSMPSFAVQMPNRYASTKRGAA
jgi:hypothetical protein